MPFIPVFIGVIVLGLVIGAGLSMLARRNEPQQVAAKAPSPHPTFAPITPAPTEKPTAEPTFVPETPAVTRAPAPREAATLAPASARTAQATHTPLATHASEAPPARQSTPPAITRAAGPAAQAVSAQPASTLANAMTAAPATNAPVSADDADSEFGKLAAGVVRQYIAAVARGDVTSAYGALGQSVPDTADLPEIGVIDGNTRIRHLEVHGSSEAAAVNVDMQGRSGLFFAQFTVHKTPSGAAVIVQHSLMK